jgi:hypothetical protein
MWHIANRSPFKTGCTWCHNKQGEEVWIVAVKGTFDFTPTGLNVSKHQEEVVAAPCCFNDNPEQGLLYDTDFVLTKVATDILLHGHAHAPDGKATRFCQVALCVGNSIAKRLHVHGDRQFTFWGMSKAVPFTKMPIVYERTWGGKDPSIKSLKEQRWDTRNPIGSGYTKSRLALRGTRAPNIEYKPKIIQAGSPPPAGFGPIPCDWAPRRHLGGTFDKQWEQNRMPILPLDFDDRFYQCAPQDQQIEGFINGGETVELYNLTPNGHLQFNLPVYSLNFKTSFTNGDEISHKANIHSVIIQPDFPRVLIVWHTHLRCHGRLNKIKSTSITIDK